MSAAEEENSRRLEAQARVGTTLRGKWRLDALLGVGGTATVYAATHRNGMRGAVKLLDRTVGALPSMRERFLREGYLANKVEHPCAVRILDDDIAEDDSAFLVMELLSGMTLEQLALERGGALPPEDVLAFMAQVLDALGAAHAIGVVHRDIKPDNLLLTQTGLIKVLDFGLARMLIQTSTPTSTQAGVLMGTPAFMSPEQARGRLDLVDVRTDLWSVAATMFTLLTGRLVHHEHVTAVEMIAATFNKQPLSLAEVLPNAPIELVAIVDHGLQLDRDARWPDAMSMGAAVSVAYESLTGMPLPLLPVPSAPISVPRLSRPSLPSLSPKSLPPARQSTPSKLSFSPFWSVPPAPKKLSETASLRVSNRRATRVSVPTIGAGVLLLVLLGGAAKTITKPRPKTVPAAAAAEPSTSTLLPAVASPVPLVASGPTLPLSANTAGTVSPSGSAERLKTRPIHSPKTTTIPDGQTTSDKPLAPTNIFDRRY